MIQIITFNQIIGFHCWPEAPEWCKYLRYIHRHVFHIRCKFNVSSTEREIEINQMQMEIKEMLEAHFDKYHDGLNFKNMSCEKIANYIVKVFPECAECEVLEDGFGGAYVRK